MPSIFEQIDAASKEAAERSRSIFDEIDAAAQSRIEVEDQERKREQERNARFIQAQEDVMLATGEELGSSAAGIANAARRAGRTALAGVEMTQALGAGAKRDDYLREAERLEQQADSIDTLVPQWKPESREKWVARARSTAEQLRKRADAMTESEGGFVAGAAQQMKKAGEIPMSEDYQRYQEAEGTQAAKEFFKSPVEVPLTIATEGLVGSLPALATGAAGAAVAGPAGLAAGLGTGSFASEYASTLFETLRDRGINPDDADAVKAALRDPDVMAEVEKRGLARGIPVAALDALSGGIAGRALRPAIKQGVRKAVRAAARETAEQAALGMTGEAAGQVSEQLATTGEVDPSKISIKDIVAEGLGEVVPGAAQVGIGAATRIAQAAPESLAAPIEQRIDEAAAAATPAAAPEPEPAPVPAPSQPAPAPVATSQPAPETPGQILAKIQAQMREAEQMVREGKPGRTPSSPEPELPLFAEIDRAAREAADLARRAEAARGNIPDTSLAPAKESHSATTEPTTAPVASREEIGDRPGATVQSVLNNQYTPEQRAKIRSKLAELNDQSVAASNVYKQVLESAPAKAEGKKSVWHEQMREQVENPSRYHTVVQDENPKGLKIGDEVVVTDGKGGKTTGFVVTVQKTSAKAYKGGYQVKVVPPVVGKYGGFHGIDRVEKISDGQKEKVLPETAQAAVGGQQPAPAPVVEPGAGAGAAPPPVGAVATKTADGVEITPTKPTDSKVSQLVTKKQFTAQRKFLLDAVAKAVDAAPETGSETVTIHVPDDGTFTVANTKPALKRFGDAIAKRFGKTFTLPLKGGERGAVTSPFYESQGAYKAPAASPIPPLKKKTTLQDRNKLISAAVSSDPTRPVLEHVLSEGGLSIATDGARMFIMADAGGKSREEVIAFERARSGNPEYMGSYPNWRQAVPPWVRTANGKITIGRDAPKSRIQLDTEETAKALNQVFSVASERATSAEIFDLGAGHVGFGIQNPDLGDYYSEGVQDGMIATGVVNPEFLHQAIAAARGLGHDKASLYINPDGRQMVLTAGNDFAAVIMQHKHDNARVAGGVFGEKTKNAAAPRAGSAAMSSVATPPPGNFVPPNAPPADNPNFSQLPFQLPELVQFYRQISGGKNPKIVERIRKLHGTALGVFRYREGQPDSGQIELRADLFHLLSQEEKRKLMDDAVAWATAMKQANPGLDFHEAIRGKFHELVKQAEAEAMQRDPTRALWVFAHEIGHFVDFLGHNIGGRQEATLRRGNILGRMATLKDYLYSMIADRPDYTGDWSTFPSRAEKLQLREQAEKELRDAVQTITETLRKEIPVFAEIPITADHITGILKTLGRDEFPEFYNWFAGLDRATKADVLRKAMRGIVDERAARFSKRVQTGTQVVEETVTRTIGEEPTPEAIRRRYEELLRQELKARGLISIKDIKAELEGVIAWWHNRQTIPAYFKTAEEMYAETFSILMNNPAALAKRAPTWWNAFQAYMVRKPEVKKVYDKIQDDIKSGAIHAQRVQNLRDSWRVDEESGLNRERVQHGIGPWWRQMKDTLNLAFNKHQGPIQALARKHLGTTSADKLMAALKDYLYRQTAVEGLARQINIRVEKALAEQNLAHSDLSEFMFHNRIVNGDAVETANSQGWSPNTSAQRLDEMRQQLGQARFDTLRRATQAMRDIYEQGPVRLLELSQTLTPELMKKIKENVHYSPFNKARDAFNPLDESTIRGMLDAAYGKDITAQIFHRQGYLGDIQSPYLALVKKAESLMRFAYWQTAAKSTVSYLREFEADSIEEAPLKFNGHGMAPEVVLSPRVGTIVVLENGKPRGYYVPRAIYESLQQSTGIEQIIVNAALKVLAWPKAILTELNPGFWPVMHAKDVVAAALQMPRGIRSLRNYPRAYKAARATFTGKEDPLADTLLSRLMVISRADPRGEHLGHPDEMNRWLMRMSKHPELWDSEAKKIGLVLRFWEAWKRQGQILERTTKAMGMIELDRAYGAPAPNQNIAWVTMPEAYKKRLVNELSGSPDFNERGRATSVIEAMPGGLMFFNPWLRGIESFYRSGFKPLPGGQSRAAFWGKFMFFFGLPAMAFYAFERGLTNLGKDPEEAEDERDQLRSIPERDKLRGFVIPLGWADKQQGKVAYVVLPFPDQVRTVHAGLRKLMQSSTGDAAAHEGMGSLLQYQGQDLPGQNPFWQEGAKWWEFYVQGRNPYDPFRGRPVLDEDVFLAGGGRAREELAEHSFSNITGGFIKRHRPEIPGEVRTDTERFLDTPFVSNLLGRWVRVSNAGLREQDAAAIAPVQKERAELRLVADEMMRKTLAGEVWTEKEFELASLEPYIAQYIMDKSKTYMAMAQGPELTDYMRANQEERIALMKMWMDRYRARQERLEAAGAGQ